MKTIEYRVRPVTRYIVTRFEQEVGGSGGSIATRGEYDNGDVAYEVGYALCKSEHDELGWPVGDERITYPTRRQAQGLSEFPNVAVARPSKTPSNATQG